MAHRFDKKTWQSCRTGGFVTHLELISILNRHKETLDKAYKGRMPEEIDQDLIETGIFLKIGHSVFLNDAYKNFIDTLLKNAEYETIFGSYEKESKRLIYYKKRYLQTKERTYLIKIKKGIAEIYSKLKTETPEFQHWFPK